MRIVWPFNNPTIWPSEKVVALLGHYLAESINATRPLGGSFPGGAVVLRRTLFGSRWFSAAALASVGSVARRRRFGSVRGSVGSGSCFRLSWWFLGSGTCFRLGGSGGSVVSLASGAGGSALGSGVSAGLVSSVAGASAGASGGTVGYGFGLGFFVRLRFFLFRLLRLRLWGRSPFGRWRTRPRGPGARANAGR